MPRRVPVYRHEVVTGRREGQAITASSRIYTAGPHAEKLRKVGQRSRDRSWQSDLWDYYDVVPEYRFGCDWVGNLLSRAKLYVAGPDGAETENKHALDALASLFDGPEGQEEMLRLLGVNFTVAGEAWLFGVEGKNGDEWQVAAASEVYEEGQKLKVEGDVLPEGALGIRLWKAHPRISTEPNSPSRAVMPVLNQIVTLSKVIDAQANSRLTGNGILFIPQEIELPAIPMTMNDGDGETTSLQAMDAAASVTAQLIKIAKMAIQDRDSAAAQIPLIIAAEGQYLEKIQHIDLWSKFDEAVREIIVGLIDRLAIGMDMPPEVIKGTGDMNHWGAWSVEEAAIKAHTEPLLGVITASLTTGYLRPYLEGMGVPDAEKYSFEADTSALRLRPNRSKEALELYDRGALARKTLLVENGFDPEIDLMDEKEYKTWLLQKIASGSTTPDQVAMAARLLTQVDLPGTADEGQITQEARPTRSLAEHPERRAPLEEETTTAPGVQASATAPFVVDGLVLAAEQMVYRALERAGNRLKTRMGGRNVGTDAAELYMSVASVSAKEADELLADAWAAVDRFDYPIDKERLRATLNEFTFMLLCMQKPYRRDALARHLLLEMDDAE